MSEEIDCKHLDKIQVVKPAALGCVDCLEMDFKEWNHLRLCLFCGNVGCCDGSPHKHATKHWQETGHHIVYLGLPGVDHEHDGDYIWCWTCDEFGTYSKFEMKKFE